MIEKVKLVFAFKNILLYPFQCLEIMYAYVQVAKKYVWMHLHNPLI